MPKTLVSAILLFAALAVIGFLIVPQWQQLSEAKGQLKVKKTELQQREDYFSQLRTVARNFEALPEVLIKINNAIPDNPEFDKLINFLAVAAQQQGLVLTEISNVTVAAQESGKPNQEPQNFLRGITLSLRLTGSYPALKNFLLQVEDSARLLEVERLAFVPAKTAGAFQFELDLKTQAYRAGGHR
jgi:Tfp pilus assembly protein PilO